MLKSNKINLILALVVAIVLWSYVLVDVNQSSTDTVKGVPITILNEDELAAEDLVILSTDYEKVNISYSCQRSAIGKIKKSDFSVTIDVEGLRKGTHKLKLYISSPDDVSIENVSIQKITVVVDDLVTEAKPVNTVIANIEGDDAEPNILQVSDEQVKITGAKTLIDKVTSVNAILDASKVGTEMKSFTVSLIPVDSNGNQVEGVTASKENISITAVLLQKKTVELEVPVEGLDSTEYERSISMPKTITIKGRDSVLATIESITCQTVDLSDVYEDTEIKLVPDLPLGVSVATESESLCLKVTVKGVETSTFTFSENDVEINGITEDMLATAGSVEIKVTVMAKSDDLEDITREDFVLAADVEGLEAGEHEVALTCTCKKTHADLEYTPTKIKITVENTN